MIDETPERLCQFNDQEIRRKGKLLMAKVGTTLGTTCARDGARHPLDYKAREREVVTTKVGLQIAPESCPVAPAGIMDSGINETAGGGP